MELSKKELDALRQEYASGATDAQFDLWIEMCKRRNLIPVEDVVLQLRSVKEYDPAVKAKVFKQKVIFITTIRALLKLAERTGRYKGFVPAEYIYLDDQGRPMVISLVPLPDENSTIAPRIPWAARIGVKRQGFDEPQFTVCRFWAYAQTYEHEDEGGLKKKILNSTWKIRGPEQLVKCTKAAALRDAFPEELGGMYLEEELQNEEVELKEAVPVIPATTPPAAVVAPPVNQVPAEGKDNPRPGHEEPVPAPVETPTEAPVETPAEKPAKKQAKAKKKEAEPAPVVEPTPAPEPAKETVYEALPTKEQKVQLTEKLQKISAKVGREALNTFILNEAKAENTRTITVSQWDSIMKKLNTAVDDEDLKTIVASGGVK
jgi:hypothetical protein